MRGSNRILGGLALLGLAWLAIVSAWLGCVGGVGGCVCVCVCVWVVVVCGCGGCGGWAVVVWEGKDELPMVRLCSASGLTLGSRGLLMLWQL